MPGEEEVVMPARDERYLGATFSGDADMPAYEAASAEKNDHSPRSPSLSARLPRSAVDVTGAVGCLRNERRLVAALGSERNPEARGGRLVLKFLRRRLGIDDLRDQVAALLAVQVAYREREAADIRKLEVELLQAVAEGRQDRASDSPVSADPAAILKGLLERLDQRDERHLLWTQDVAKRLAAANQEARATNATLALHLQRSGERDDAHLQWTQDVARRIAATSQEARAANGLLATHLQRLGERDDRHVQWMQDVAQRIATTNQELQAANVPQRLAHFENVLKGMEQALRSDLANRMVRWRGDATAAVSEPPDSSRRFGVSDSSPSPDLQGLLGLARWVPDDFEAAKLLSRITGSILRDLFPAGEPQVRTIRCRSGLGLDADMSDIFAASAAFGGLQEADDFALFMSLVEPGSKVIDVGANFGLYALHAALYAGPQGRVVAFEPGPDAFALLERNAAQNGMADRVSCIAAAVGEDNATVRFNVAADSAFSGLADTARSPSARTVDVPLARLDDDEAARALGPVDLIKIDVEGFEAGVLAGARETILRSPNIIGMFEYSFKNLDDARRAALIDELVWLERAGVSIWLKAHSGRDLKRVAAANLDATLNENLFFCREGVALDRLRAALETLEEPPLRSGDAAALLLLRSYAASAKATKG